jgi:hypothetical protein
VEAPTTISKTDQCVSGSGVNRDDWNIQSDLLLSQKLTATEATATRATTLVLTNIQEVATPVTQAPAVSPVNPAEASWTMSLSLQVAIASSVGNGHTLLALLALVCPKNLRKAPEEDRNSLLSTVSKGAILVEPHGRIPQEEKYVFSYLPLIEKATHTSPRSHPSSVLVGNSGLW